tara:strand:- start:2513 stop:4987 length:2475 start_codon:yes stop_codon:yes gene_type:complete
MSNIQFNEGASIAAGTNVTISWSTSVSGMKYYNSTGNSTYSRFTDNSKRSGTLTTATSAPFQSVSATVREPIHLLTGAAISSGTVRLTLRTGNTGGTIIFPTSGQAADGPLYTIYRTPTTPNAPTFSNITGNSVTVSASGGDWGTLQVKRYSTSQWYTAPHTFTGLSAGTQYQFIARRANVVAFSPEVSATVSTIGNPLAPSISPSVSLREGGFDIFANESGPSTPVVTYAFASGGVTYQNTTASSLGVGVTWEGSTWTVTATSTTASGTDVEGPVAVVLPSFSLSANSSSVVAGNSNTMRVNVSNLNGTQTIYWKALPANRFSTSTGSLAVSNGNNNTFSVSTEELYTDANATIKIYTASGMVDSGAIELIGTATFDIDAADVPLSSPSAPSVTSNDLDSSEVVAVATAGGGTGGTLQIGQSNSSSTLPTTWYTGSSISFTHPRGQTKYYWARRSSSHVSSSTSHTVGYKTGIIDSTIVIGTLNPTSPLAVGYGDATGENVSVPYTGGSAGDQYRIKSNDTGQNWISTQNGATGSFTLSGSATSGYQLPGNGQTFTYFFEGRRASFGGAAPQNSGDNWVSVNNGATIQITGGGSAYSFDTSTSTSINESGTAVWTINTTAGAVANGTTIGYSITGVNTGDFSNLSSLTGTFTVQNNTATLSASLIGDSFTEGNETAVLTLNATDSAGNSTGGISRSITILDSSTGSSGSGSTPGGGTGDYGLLLKNTSGTVMLDETSRVSNIIATGTYHTANSPTSILFQGIDCTDQAETAFIVSWSESTFYATPTITRRDFTAGDNSSGGILLTRSTLDTDFGLATVILIRY